MGDESIPAGTAVKLILFLIMVTLVITVLTTVIVITRTSAPEAVCGLSARAQDITKTDFGVVDFESPFDLYCPRKAITVTEDGAQLDLFDILHDRHDTKTYSWVMSRPLGSDDSRRPVRTLSDDRQERQLEIQALLAQEMQSCWRAFLEGRVDPINADSRLFSLNTCVICSQIEIQADFDAFTQQQLHTHLHEYELPYDTEEPSNFYSQLYHSREPAIPTVCLEEQFPALETSRIEPGETYAVVYMRRGSDFYDAEEVDGETPYTAAQMADERLSEALGKDVRQCQAVGIIPLVQVPTHCQVVVN